MTHRFSIAFAVVSLLAAPVLAQQGDDLVRLPGHGEVKLEQLHDIGAERLAPGGGLMASFDADENGRISPAELEAGILAAFKDADSNADGGLTPLEQQAWASGLPTHDDSLFNPTRFDPNLDRTVSAEEFSIVVHAMAAGYTQEGSDEVILATLQRQTRRGTKAIERRESRERRPFDRSSDRRQTRY